jgi:hypothetical protein
VRKGAVDKGNGEREKGRRGRAEFSESGKQRLKNEPQK